MLDIDYLFSEDKDVIIAVLVEKIRDQNCDLENLQEQTEDLKLKLRYADDVNAQLKIDLAAVKKASKAPKKIKVSKALKVITPEKRKPGRPKKVAK